MSLPFRLNCHSMFDRPNEETKQPKRVVFLSVEGTTTEVNYFRFVEQFRCELNIEAIVHVEVLRKTDTDSDPQSVLRLLEDYVEFREKNQFQEELKNIELQSYDLGFIQSYINGDPSITQKQRRRFEAFLQTKHLDLQYLDFLSKFRGENDIFGIVIDRDKRSHSIDQLQSVLQKCVENNYRVFLTNPCFEFWQLLHVSNVMEEYTDHLQDILENSVDSQGNTYVSNALFEKTQQRKNIQRKAFLQYYLPNINIAIERAKGFAHQNELIYNIGTDMGELFDLLREKLE